MPPSPAINGVKPVRQKRSEETRERILGALSHALAEGEIDSMGVHDIAARAGASVGAFYGRFADKDAALAALLEKKRAAFVAAFLAKFEETDSVDAWARRASGLALDFARKNRALFSRLEMTSIFASGRIAELPVIDRLAILFRERFALPLSPAGAPGAAAFALAIIGAMARDAAVHSEAALAAPKTRAWFIEETARAVTAYLRGL